GKVLLRVPGGRKMSAEALLDLSAAEWRITKLELVAARKSPPLKDVGRVFGAAVLREYQTGSKRDGEFTVTDESGKKRRLKLKMIPNEGIAGLGEGEFRSCVYFTDIADGSSVGVDFFANLDGESGQVFKTAMPCSVAGAIQPKG